MKQGEKDIEATVVVQEVNADLDALVKSTVDVAVNESLTFKTAAKILMSPITWLPAFAYLTTFGLELAVDARMADVLYALFNKRVEGFDQTVAGYYTAILWENPYILFCVILILDLSGMLNLVTRPLGGVIGDLIYRPFGTNGKKLWTLFCGLSMGVAFLAGGLYLENHKAPHLADRESLIF